MKFIIIFIFFVTSCNIFCTKLFAQNPEDEETETYTREYIGGISFYSNGGIIGSLLYRSNYAITPTRFWGWGIEITNIKSPKEYQVQSQATGNNFIFGKMILLILRIMNPSNNRRQEENKNIRITEW